MRAVVLGVLMVGCSGTGPEPNDTSPVEVVDDTAPPEPPAHDLVVGGVYDETSGCGFYGRGWAWLTVTPEVDIHTVVLERVRFDGIGAFTPPFVEEGVNNPEMPLLAGVEARLSFSIPEHGSSGGVCDVFEEEVTVTIDLQIDGLSYQGVGVGDAYCQYDAEPDGGC